MKKRILIFSIFFAYIFGFYFLCLDKVSAKELTQFKENGYSEITTELIEQIINNNNLDVTFNDAYLLVAYLTSNNQKYYHLIFFNSNNMKNGVNYINSKNYFTFVGTDIFNINTNSLSSSSVLYKSKDTWLFGATSKLPENLVYYSTIDVYDENGDVFFKCENNLDNSNKGIEIVNDLANITKDYYINLKNNNIKFEYVLLGMFIVNYLIYTLCYIIRRF